MLGGGAAGASPSPPKTASSRAAGAGSGGGAAAARGVSRGSGVGVSSTRAKSFDAGVENTRGDTLERRGTMCEGTRGRRGGAGDGAGAAGGESGRKLAVQLVRVSFSSLPRKLCLAMAPAARRRAPAAPGCYRALVCARPRAVGALNDSNVVTRS